MSSTLTPMEMFAEMAAKGYFVPANVEPSGLMVPTAYISVPTQTVFSTPVPSAPETTKTQKKARPNAKLAARSRRNTKRNKRQK